MMKFSIPAVFLALAVSASARVPLVRRQSSSGPTDVQILNFALTLEHLENAFYSGALKKFSAADFANAGFASFVRGRFEQISAHEASHVAFLQQALGANATQPCTYNFPYTDTKTFVALSSALESVGASAYTGAAKYISNKDYLTAAATVLSTEARHSAWVESTGRKGAAWGTAYETPLDINQVYTLASAFITSCPSTNPALPVVAYPALAVSGKVIAGGTIGLNYTQPTSHESLYATFLNGANAVVVALNTSTTEVTIPDSLRGYTYLSVTTDSTGLDSSKTVAGPAILDLSFNSQNRPAVLN